MSAYRITAVVADRPWWLLGMFERRTRMTFVNPDTTWEAVCTLRATMLASPAVVSVSAERIDEEAA